MNSNRLLGITIDKQTKRDILEKIKKYFLQPTGFFHIVSLNPENLVVVTQDKLFYEIVATAQIRLVDGVGVVAASRLLGLGAGERITGVGLMEELLKMAGDMRLRVLFIGGRHNLALKLAQCQQQLHPEASFRGIEGVKNITEPAAEEEKAIFSIVSVMKPNIVFASFGSPAQEKWFWKNRAHFEGAVCMGVGGAFDYLGGNVIRAPKIIQQFGLEWLFRLFHQPWRWKRQLRLIKFGWLVLKQWTIKQLLKH